VQGAQLNTEVQGAQLNTEVQGVQWSYSYLLVGDDLGFNDAVTHVMPVDVCQDGCKVQLLFAWRPSWKIIHDWLIFSWFKTGLVSLRLRLYFIHFRAK
jgi:hypothetical protein